MKNRLILFLAMMLVFIISACSISSDKNNNIKIKDKNIATVLSDYDSNDINFLSLGLDIDEFKKIEFETYLGESIVWDIIYDSDEYYYLLSDKIIECKPYENSDENIGHLGSVEVEDTVDSVSFINSSFCDFLNNEFLDSAFNIDEKEKLVYVNDTDEIFVTLPSINNLKDLYGKLNYERNNYYNKENFFDPNENIIALPTKNATNNGIFVFNNEEYANGYEIDERYNFATNHSPYWLLDSTDEQDSVFYVIPTGYISFNDPDTQDIGIRPIIKIKKYYITYTIF